MMLRPTEIEELKGVTDPTERLAIYLAYEHTRFDTGGAVFRWADTDEVFQRSFRTKARNYLSAACGDTLFAAQAGGR